jgi:hypothetical protein
MPVLVKQLQYISLSFLMSVVLWHQQELAWRQPQLGLHITVALSASLTGMATDV